MTTKDDFTKIKLLRWEKFPEFLIYNDQLQKIVNDSLEFLTILNEGPWITKSIINNYTKIGLLPKSEHKLYNKNHIAITIIITAFKQILSTKELIKIIPLIAQENEIKKNYDLFCDYLENITEIINSESSCNFVNSESKLIYILCLSFIGKLKGIYYEREISNEKNIIKN